jgi:sugar phosphate isomerase/epimerase
MQLAISVRIAEGFLSKEIPIIPLEEVVSIASRSGYSALCMRASQVGIHSPPKSVQTAIEIIQNSGLKVNMLTGDFDMVYNNEKGPNAVRNIGPYLRLAAELGAPLVRVALQREQDIPWAQRAADEAAEMGIRLVHQCHTLSLFETVESIESALKKIDRPNFGLVYEPANLQLCNQEYGAAAIERLAPWIFNVYLQNQQLQVDGSVTLDTWYRGPISFNVVPIHMRGSLDFKEILDALARIEYQGFVTVHQSATADETPAQSAQRTADFLRELLPPGTPGRSAQVGHSCRE